MAAVHGALRCLALIASDIDEAQMPVVVPVLLPELQAIISAPKVRHPNSESDQSGEMLSSRGCFATPADSPLQDCSPYRGATRTTRFLGQTP